jgi:hypothetical protein
MRRDRAALGEPAGQTRTSGRPRLSKGHVNFCGLRRIFNYLVGLLVSVPTVFGIGSGGFGWFGRVLVFRAGKPGNQAAGHFRAFGSGWFWLVLG